MDDWLQIILDWDPEFEQIYRYFGYEILEPMEMLTVAELRRVLTMSEMLRACRWPCAFGMFMGFCGDAILGIAGLGQTARVIVAVGIVYAITFLLSGPAYRRAYERRRSSLQA